MFKKNKLIDTIIVVLGILAVCVVAKDILPENAIAADVTPEYSITISDEVCTYIKGSRVSVEDLQINLGFTGKDVDGVVGKKTINATLAANRD